MDAVDCALVDFNGGKPTQLDFINTEIPDDLRQKLLYLCEDHHGQIPLLGETDVEFARLLALSVNQILEINGLKPSQIAAIGSHGQTIRHLPHQNVSNYPFTIQIGDPNTIAELTKITTVADFRRRDLAAGGQGAPIVPAFHRKIFFSAENDRVIINIGGMSNITVLKKNGDISGHDTGPGNVLMDLWIQQNLGHPYDKDGAWANSGDVAEDLMTILLDEPYFQLRPPKSTGRELFNQHWLNRKLTELGKVIAPEHVQAALLALTVETIKNAVNKELGKGQIIICGGGAYNSALMEGLAEALPAFQVMPSSRLGVMEDSMEAVAFAWLAKQTLSEQPVDFTDITGSSHPVIVGGVYFSGNRVMKNTN
jgi:anhydro-N-acetylmuramic acid kinase